jgi:hypothetical protein
MPPAPPVPAQQPFGPGDRSGTGPGGTTAPATGVDAPTGTPSTPTSAPTHAADEGGPGAGAPAADTDPAASPPSARLGATAPVAPAPGGKPDSFFEELRRAVGDEPGDEPDDDPATRFFEDRDPPDKGSRFFDQDEPSNRSGFWRRPR